MASFPFFAMYNRKKKEKDRVARVQQMWKTLCKWCSCQQCAFVQSRMDYISIQTSDELLDIFTLILTGIIIPRLDHKPHHIDEELTAKYTNKMTF